MIVKLKLVNGNTQMFETADYVVNPIKIMHPDILSVKVYSNDRKILFTVKRKFQLFYKKFIYKPVENKPE